MKPAIFITAHCRKLLASLVILAASLHSPLLFAAQSVMPPDDPRQSITYWKQHTVSPETNDAAARAHAIFDILLRGWDNSRLAPGLYVVESAGGAWAASLADGNILLSQQAIDACMQFGEQRGEHLLAFVLSHELAHQRADDLWHQRFFRMIGNDSPAIRNKIINGLKLDANVLADLEQKEAQADHDGLLLMASVGFDPYRVLDSNSNHKDFFTLWVENLWRQTCDETPGNDTAFNAACQQAQARALRSRVQLNSIATQSMLYQLGVQAFVARRYQQAREYFTRYGRDYPSRAVLSALGLTWLAQAQDIHAKLIAAGAIKQPAFYYPLMLDASPQAEPVSTSGNKRANQNAYFAQQREAMHKALQQGIEMFEKAIRRQPQHKKSYLLLATAHLLDNNPYMARGILQGRYQPEFGKDASSRLLLAMTSAIEGKHQQAQREFDRLLADAGSPAQNASDNPTAMPENLLLYSAYYNSAELARFNGDAARATALWKQLAKQAKSSGNSLLFRMALTQLTQQQANTPAITGAPTIEGKRLGDHLDEPATGAASKTARVDELWIDGEQYQVVRASNGSRYITDANGNIVSAVQQSGDASLAALIHTGDRADRAFKTLGLPDRRVDMQSGEYLVYDRYGVALHILNDRVKGWFLYHSAD